MDQEEGNAYVKLKNFSVLNIQNYDFFDVIPRRK